jgi:hypothetical protein
MAQQRQRAAAAATVFAADSTGGVWQLVVGEYHWLLTQCAFALSLKQPRSKCTPYEFHVRLPHGTGLPDILSSAVACGIGLAAAVTPACIPPMSTVVTILLLLLLLLSMLPLQVRAGCVGVSR